MKKLVYVSQSYLPSSKANGVHVVNMCDALSSIFEDVVLIHAGKKGQKERESLDFIRDYYGVHARYRTIKITWFNIKGMAFIYSINAFFKSFSEAGVEGVIYSRSLYTAFLLSLIGRAGIIYETHALPRTKLQEFMEYVVFRSRHVSKIVVITHSLHHSYRNKFKKRKFLSKFYVAPDGAPASLVNTGEEPRKITKPGCFHAVYTGSLMPGKGAELVLDIAREMPHVKFTIVGGLSSEVERFNKVKTPNVRLVGYIHPKFVVNYQREADILLLPNQPSVIVDGGRVDIGAWTSPLKLFEYMASGRPIVASELDVLKEVLVDRENCLMANPLSSSSWVKCISEIMENPCLAKKIAGNALYDFQNKYTWESRARLIIDSLTIK